MRFLVTGATGFIGSHVVDHILHKGWNALCPVRDTAKPRNLSGRAASLISMDKLDETLDGSVPVDYIIHLAGATRARNLQGFRKHNVNLTRRMLDLAAKLHARHPLSRFVLVSSQAAAGPSLDQVTPVKEADEPHPVSMYGRSKLESEQLAWQYADDLPVTVVRPPAVFGPRDEDFLSVFRSAKFRVQPYLAGPDRLVSIVYVEDLVEGILKATLSRQAAGEIYFLANSEPVIWREFCLQVGKVMGKRALGVPVPLSMIRVVGLAGDLITSLTGRPPLIRSDKYQDMKQIAWICTAEKALEDLDWRPSHTVESGILKTVQWYRKKGWI